MMRKIITIVILCFFSYTTYASSQAVTLENFPMYTACIPASYTSSPAFCASFKAAAKCYCTRSGLPGFLCNDVKALYHRLISFFGSLKKACEYQKDTSFQTCMDDWNCYLYGGRNANNELCNSTGQSC